MSGSPASTKRPSQPISSYVLLADKMASGHQAGVDQAQPLPPTSRQRSLTRSSSAALPLSALSKPATKNPVSPRFPHKRTSRRRRSRSSVPVEALPWEMSSEDSEEERARAQDTISLLKRQLTLHESSRRTTCGSPHVVPLTSSGQDGRAILGNDLEMFHSKGIPI